MPKKCLWPRILDNVLYNKLYSIQQNSIELNLVTNLVQLIMKKSLFAKLNSIKMVNLNKIK